MRTYRDLVVWQKAIELVTLIYKITKPFPEDEKYSLVSQIRRAAVSIPSNIAEGYGRKHTNDCSRYLQISIGSVFELQTQLIISKILNYVDNEQYNNIENKTREIERMLSSLISKIKH
ncbi:MAG: four helix bundle protein [Bacteroidales bacterium]|nr:four helix bundle protein [Bacteroidales bacterium]